MILLHAILEVTCLTKVILHGEIPPPGLWFLGSRCLTDGRYIQQQHEQQGTLFFWSMYHLWTCGYIFFVPAGICLFCILFCYLFDHFLSGLNYIFYVALFNRTRFLPRVALLYFNFFQPEVIGSLQSCSFPNTAYLTGPLFVLKMYAMWWITCWKELQNQNYCLNLFMNRFTESRCSHYW